MYIERPFARKDIYFYEVGRQTSSRIDGLIQVAVICSSRGLKRYLFIR